MNRTTRVEGLICTLAVYLAAALAAPAGAHPRDYSVEVSATVSESPPRIAFAWTADPAARHYFVFKKAPADTLWAELLAVLPGSATSFADEEVSPGVAYEYSFQKTLGFIADTLQVPSGTAVTFTIRDSWGDGICCHHGLGSYEVTGCGVLYASGGAFGSSESTSFVVGAGGEPCDELIVAVTLDIFGQETTWELTDDETGFQIAAGGPYDPPHFGHILSGIRVGPVEHPGTVLLLVEAEKAAPLSVELTRLELDLIRDGYRVRREDVSGNEEVPAVKDRILAACGEDPTISALFLLGHIAVPYSGDVRSAHSDHQGAWPADLYYGELDGAWSDSIVTNTTASRPENHNVPGDGKFDQTFLPSEVDLEVGRVDLSRLPAFSFDEIGLLQRYLEKNHAWRSGQVEAQPRGLIDDNAGDAWGAAFAACGWRNFSSMFTAAHVAAGDFFPTLETQSHLWVYGCGPSGYTSCGGVGSTLDFATRTVLAPFTILYGSYFGDWDNENNVLRAPLAAQGYPLVCFWAGRPTWHLYRMALGHSIGHCTRLTQNNHILYTVGEGGRQIHVALMGDPTLRMHVVKPPANLIVRSEPPESVVLTWSPSSEEVAGYHVYRAPALQGSFARLTTGPVADTTFTDPMPLPETNVYLVRAIKLVTSGSGSYWNLSAGVIDSLATASAAEPHPAALELACHPNPFVHSTLFCFTLAAVEPARLRIFDVTGALVRTLADGPLPPGTHVQTWDGRDDREMMTGSGIYFGRLEVGDRCSSAPVIRLR